MSWFGKKKAPDTSYMEHAPGGLYDLHTHVLPGLDDGARSIDEAIIMLGGLASLGFVEVASTPHFRTVYGKPDKQLQQSLIDDIVQRATVEVPRIIPGAETLFDDRFLEVETSGRIPTIGEGMTYLVEFGFVPNSVPAGVEEVAFKLQTALKQLIIAHPERCADLQRDPARLEALIQGGVMIQLDILSLTGRNGRTAKQTAYHLLENGQVDVVATDIHRKADLDDLADALSTLAAWDGEAFGRLLSTNPGLILAGRPGRVPTNE